MLKQYSLVCTVTSKSIEYLQCKLKKKNQVTVQKLTLLWFMHYQPKTYTVHCLLHEFESRVPV